MIISTFLGWSLLVSGTVCNAVVLPQQVASSIALEDTTSSTVAQEPSNVDKYIAQWEELYEAYGFHSSARGLRVQMMKITLHQNLKKHYYYLTL